ncbi:MAG: hypothetical protein E7508_06305 [Ruminococcus sp.]|nr:hypothetical protein [Ruminococcus sp.]
MAADNSSYDYFLQNNPHNPNNSYDTSSNAVRKPVYEEKTETASAPNITMKITPPKRGSAVKMFFAALLALLVFFLVIYGRVETNRMYRQIAQQNELLEIAQSENVRMKSELEGKMTLKNVEEYAEKVLGLQKLDNSQINYVETQTDDIVEIPDEDKNLFTKIIDKFNGFVEYIFG